MFKQVLIKNTWLNFSETGWGNGYVLIPKDHPLYGMGYSNIEVDCLDDFVYIHGGITFSSIVDEDLLKSYSDYLNEGDIGKHMIGFDTAHAGDNAQKHDYEFVKQETQRLHDLLLHYYQNPEEVTKNKQYFSRKEVKELINSFADHHEIHWLDKRTQEWIRKNFE